MDAARARLVLYGLLLLSLGASHRTTNFIVRAPSARIAQEIAEAAERYRHDLAIEWLGRELPRWREPCPIIIDVGAHLGAGGATSFMFDRGVPFGWQMNVQGTYQRVMDSVLPHEVTHTIFATHFGRPLPRWADEGACTTVEHTSEKHKQHRLMLTFLTTGKGIPFNQMFAMMEYPADVLPLYSQGYSLARFLIQQGGKRKFVHYVGDGMQLQNWTVATQRHYSIRSLADLQANWLAWVKNGSQPTRPSPGVDGVQLVSLPTPQTLSPARTVDVSGSGVPHMSMVSAYDQKSNTAFQNVAASADSWYARRRDKANNQSRKDRQVSAGITQTTSRLQPPQPSRPIVLQWDKSRTQPTPHVYPGAPGRLLR